MTTVLLCIGVAMMAFASGVAGLYLQKLLPEPHTSDRSRDMIGAIVGLISLLLALVLGTLIGSTYSFYSTQKVWGGNEKVAAPDPSIAEPLQHFQELNEYVASLDPKTPAQRQFAAAAVSDAAAIEQTRL